MAARCYGAVALLRDRLVLVFARAPRDERRAKPLVERAARPAVEALHDGMLRHALGVARAAGARTRLVTTRDASSLRSLGEVDLALQRGSTFAERLENAVADAFADGWREVVVIGADTPRIESRHLRLAFDRLSSSRAPHAVVGPACDGGYYLLGLRRPSPELFVDVPWGTDRVLARTLEAIRAAGRTVLILEPLADIDRPEDLPLLPDDLARYRG